MRPGSPRLALVLGVALGCAPRGGPESLPVEPEPRAAAPGDSVAADDLPPDAGAPESPPPDALPPPPDALPPPLDDTAWAPVPEPVERVEVKEPCAGRADRVRFRERDGEVELVRHFAWPPQEGPHNPPWDRAGGRWEGDLLRLEGRHTPYHRDRGGRGRPLTQPVSWELRFEPESGNLVGTRNGEPIRLARADVTAADCGELAP